MSWRDALRIQAECDHQSFLSMRSGAPLCHQLHFFQMCCEKLAKSYLTGSSGNVQPRKSHEVFVRFLQLNKTAPFMRAALDTANARVSESTITKLLDIASKLERLSPALAADGPNCEYPWEDKATGKVLSPAEFDFPDFGPTSVPYMQLRRLVAGLLQLGHRS